MKRQLSMLVSLLIVAAMMLSLASCDITSLFGGQTEEHKHSFSEAWLSDATNHWHAATCDEKDDCKSATTALEAHKFGEDNKCSVCGYEKAPVENPDDPIPGSVEAPIAMTVPGEISISYVPNEDKDPVWYTFTAAVTDTLGITISSNGVMAYGTSVDDLTFTEEGQTYAEFDITEGTTYYLNFSTEDFSEGSITVKAEYVVEVAVGDLTGVYSGRNEWGIGGGITVFIVTDDDLLGGTVTFTRSHNGTDVVENYIYEIVDGEFVFLNTDGTAVNTMMTNLTLNDDNIPDVAMSNGTNYILTKSGDVVPTGFEGTYTVVSGEHSITVVIDAEMISASTNHPMTGMPMQLGSIPYTVSGGVITVDAEEAAAVGLTFEFDDKKELVSVTWEGKTYTIPVEVVEPNGTQSNPYLVTDFTATLEVGGDTDTTLKWYTFTTTEEGILTITYTSANSWVRLLDGDSVVDIDKAYELTSYAYPVEANKTYKLALGTWSALDEGETAPTATLSFTAGKIAVDGDFEKPIAFEYNYVTGGNSASYTFAAGHADKYIWFSAEHYYGVFDYVFTFSSPVNVKYGYGAEENCKLAENVTTVTVNVESDLQKIYVAVIPVDTTAEVTVTVNYEQKDPVGSENNPYTDVDVLSGADLTVKANATQKWYTFTATADGYLTFTLADANITLKEVISAWNTPDVSIVNGKYIIYKDSTYKLGIGVNTAVEADTTTAATFEAATVPHPGDFEVPNEVYTNSDIEQTANADNYVYYSFTTYYEGTVTVDLGTVGGSIAYGVNGTAADALTVANGSVTFDVTEGTKYVIGIKVAADATFKFAWKGLPGTDSNPIEVVADGTTANSATVVDSDVYFVYNPTANGTLTLTVSSSNEDAYLMYYNTAIFWYDKVLAGNSITLNVTKDTALELILSTADDYGNYGESTVITFTATFTSAPVTEEPAGNALVIGSTTVNATAGDMSSNGAEYVFTATEAGTYVIYYHAAIGYVLIDDGTSYPASIDSGETFTLEAGATQKFYMQPATWDPTATYAVVIAKVETTEAVTTAISGKVWNSDLKDSWNSSYYQLEIDADGYNDVFDLDNNGFADCTYAVEGNVISVTITADDYNGALDDDVMFVYAGESIVALFADGTAVTFTA